jgi:hypothetical protein
MLLLPVLLGVAASRPAAWQLAVAGAALTAYLASATLQAWSRTRRPPGLRAPVAVYGIAFAVLAVVLVATFPALALAAVVVLPTGLVVARGARPGTRRDLVNSLAQVPQALVLVPATAYVAGDPDPVRIGVCTAVAAAYLLGTVLVVRSVLRERGNARFAVFSVGFHAVSAILAALALPGAYAVLGVGLAVRAAALPVLQARLADGSRPLRPVHVGITEIVASLAVVLVAFLAPA